jgi:pimeloyl-ACP methyl ester carboxylesterase
MSDYADAVVRACALEPLTLIGWSMGGLVAMMAAQRVPTDALVLLEPSAPAETLGTSPLVPVSGTFDPEEVYGRTPPGMHMRPESLPARAERKAGISIPSLPERTLVVYGAEFPEERGRAIAHHYGCEGLEVPGASHWDLVRDPEIRKKIDDWLVRWT